MKWISVKEQLPEKYLKVIAWGKPKNECSCDQNWRAMEASYRGNDKNKEAWVYGEYDCDQEVTHWMNMPSEPSKDQNETKP